MKHSSILIALAGMVAMGLWAEQIPALGADKSPATKAAPAQADANNPGQVPKKDDSEFADIIKQAEAEANLYMTEQPITDGIGQKLRTLTYDAKSVRSFTTALSTQRKPVAQLYVANKLMIPLMQADKDVIEAAYKSIEALHAKYEKYQDPPQLPRERLNQLKMPDPNQPLSLKQMAAIQRERENKRAQELPVLQHNEQLYILEKNMVRLLLRMGSPQDDDQVMQMLIKTEAAKLWIFTDISDIIMAECKSFTPERAKKFYDKIRPVAEQLRLERKVYTNPGEVLLHPADASAFDTQNDFTGIRLAKLVNSLAAVAKAPTIGVPTQEEVQKAGKK